MKSAVWGDFHKVSRAEGPSRETTSKPIADVLDFLRERKFNNFCYRAEHL
jgi:hypothetical protein